MYTLHLGNSLQLLPTLPANSIDAIVCDPPYELGFMGKSWDTSGIAYNVTLWKEAMRVLKPGGHLLAFSGSRTYHRMTCAIEDAGFEIRDQIMWVYSAGFPKSLNLDRERGKAICGCGGANADSEPEAERELCTVRYSDVPTPLDTGEGGREVLQSGVSQSGAPLAGRAELSPGEVRCGQPGMERGRNGVHEEGKLRKHTVRAGADTSTPDGTQGRVHHGTPPTNGDLVRATTDTNRSGTSCGPQPIEQPVKQPRVVAGQQKPQTSGAWPICGGCGKPNIPTGLGTALKPAHEPICVARKPLAKGLTVAANVLEHAVGALNIDGCRVAGEPWTAHKATGLGSVKFFTDGENPVIDKVPNDLGRWPANLIHDGSDEVLALFPDTKSGALTAEQQVNGGFKGTVNCYGTAKAGGTNGYPGSSGSAARFFYCAKTSKRDRNEGCEHVVTHENGTEKSGNIHSTVKPTDLMRYLCRLVTPPGGTVLDPFMGSGSTGKGAILEGFRFVGVEMSEEYMAIAAARIEAAFESTIADMI